MYLRSSLERSTFMKRWYVLIIFTLLMTVGCKEVIVIEDTNEELVYEGEVDEKISTTQRVDNLVAFCKLYGYVRFFHPIKETTKIDWDKFAIYGVEQVIDAPNSQVLRERLIALFHPIAPTLRIVSDPDFNYNYGEQNKEEELFYMKHNGVGINETYAEVYNSVVSRYDTEKGVLPEVPFVYKAQLIDGMYSHVPILLYESDTKIEFFKGDFVELKSHLDKINLEDKTGETLEVRVADTIILWNIVQHFFPYFEDLEVNWESELGTYLEMAMQNQGADDFTHTLRKMIQPLEDGHGAIWLMDKDFKGVRLPFRVDYIEDEVIVSYSIVDDVKIGDILLTIDDIPAKDLLEQGINDFCGSPQYKLEQALNFMTTSFKGKQNADVVLIRQGKKVHLTLDYLNLKVIKYDYPRFEEIEDGIYYIRLMGPYNEATLTVHLEELKKAKGIIFDNRGYPRGDDIRYTVSPYISADIIQSPEYKVMQSRLPDRKSYVYVDECYDYLPDNEKFLSGKIVFLINESAISAAENMPYMVKHNNLGTLVGQPTAGANGNINSYTLPGNYYFKFTGMRIENPDGSRFHGVGVEPDYYVDYTIDDILNGRDSYIDMAVQIINGAEVLK